MSLRNLSCEIHWHELLITFLYYLRNYGNITTLVPNGELCAFSPLLINLAININILIEAYQFFLKKKTAFGFFHVSITFVFYFCSNHYFLFPI